METTRKVYLSLNVFGFDLSLGRTTKAEDSFSARKYTTEIPISMPMPSFTGFTNSSTTTTYAKSTKSKKPHSLSYYRRKKYQARRRRDYKLNKNGMRDKAIAYSRETP